MTPSVSMNGVSQSSAYCVAIEGDPVKFLAGVPKAGLPGGGGGDGGHVAGVWGLPVRLVETHHVFRGLRWWEVLKGNVAFFFASCSVTDGRGRFGFVEVTVAP